MTNMVRNTVKTLAMTGLLCAAAAARGGDIISIDVLEDYPYSLENGGKSYPNWDAPHTIGEKISIRVRLVNADEGSHNSAAYQWEFRGLSSGSGWSLLAPRLGLSAGGVPRYATLVSCQPAPVSVSRESEKYMTDLIFEYTVQPGDLAQPLRLLNKDGKEAVEGDEYYILKPTAGSDFYGIDGVDVERTAVFSFCNSETRTKLNPHYPEANASADERGTPSLDYTLMAAGVYIKTIDFDSEYVDLDYDPTGVTNIWRIIHQGSTTPTKYGNPSIVVDAAADFEGTGYATMWVWTEDDSILTPVGATQTFNGRKALPVTISTGDERKSFVLKATGTEGQGAWVYMSSAPTNIYGTAGQLVTNTVQRYIAIGARLKPSVAVTFGGNSWTEATATSEYMDNDYPVEMSITLSEPFTEDVTVTLTPVLKNPDGLGGATNIDVYANHVIATAPDKGLGNGWQLATNTVTFAKDSEVEKLLYVYPLGATKNTTRSGGTGIEFMISVEPASAAAHFESLRPGILYVNAADPVVGDSFDTNPSFTAGQPQNVRIPLNDACRNMRYLSGGAAEVVANGTNLYSVVWQRNDDTSTDPMTWTGLVPDAQGALVLEGVKYPNSGTYSSSKITVTSPDGTTVNIPVTAEVSVQRTVTASADRPGLVYYEGETAQISVALSKRDGEDLYAFVEPLNESASNCLACADGLIVKDGAASGAGVLIPGTGTAGSRTIDLSVLDGPATPKFQVVLCSEETYDPAKVVSRYTPVPLTLTCRNVAPVGAKIDVGGTVLTNNQRRTYGVPSENSITLKLTVDDVPADRLLPRTANEDLIAWTRGDTSVPEDVTNNIFIAKWDFYNAKEKKVSTLVTFGTGNRLAITNFTFTSLGDNKIVVRMLDKDMVKALLNGGTKRDEIIRWTDGTGLVDYDDENGFWDTMISEDDWGPAFTVTIPVDERPFVTITPENAEIDVNGNLGWKEGLKGRKFDIALSEAAERNLQLKVWVERAANMVGVAQSIPKWGTLVVNGEELGQDTNDYVVVSIRNGRDTASVTVDDMDGTPYSWYIIHAEVTTTTPNDEGIAMKDYYLPGSFEFRVFNVDPRLTSVRANVGMRFNTVTGEASTNLVTVSQNQEIKIEWIVADDIRMDETNGLEVTWTSSEPGSTVTTNTTSGTYVTRFTQPGRKTIMLTVTDKDGGSNTYEWSFFVEASKRVYLYPHGPNGDGLSSSVSLTYLSAEGLGNGSVEASGSGLSEIQNFRQRWDYSVQSPSATIYARGLKAGEKDNRPLAKSARSGYATQNGALTSNASLAYVNTDGEFDSFVYAFINNTIEEQSQSFTPSIMKIDPQVGGNYKEQPLTLPAYQNDAVAYPDRYVEVIFSRERYVEDNLGDINQDGIPDVFAVKVWKGSNQSLITASTGLEDFAGDILDISGHNPDGDKLPGVWRQGGTLSNVGGIGTSYAPVGRDFNNMLELRGFHDGLNDLDKAVSEPSFSDDELFAWTNFVTSAEGVDKGYSTTNDAGEVTWATNIDLRVWCPEPRNGTTRMDPTDEDTDNDGFPDGWEYFFWYQAKVWHPAYDWRTRHPNDVDSKGVKLIVKDTNDAHLYPGQPRAGQTYTFERFNLDDIVNGIEITPAEVMVRFDPCTKFDPETATGYFKDDFDGDGLTDLEELLIGTNPCHWDTDGDHLCDAWEVMMCLDPLNGSKGDNADGDFMAFHSVWEDLCWIDPAAAVTDPEAEGVRIYRIQDKYGREENKLVYGVDYAQRGDKFVMLTDADVEVCSFTPKFIGPDEARERLIYGRADDRPNSGDWAYGWYMVDDVRRESIHLSNGDELAVELRYAFVHDQVLDAFGFDPRTGWSNIDGYVADRWNPTRGKAEPGEGTGVAVNTRPYAAYDEYLVMKYRLAYAIDYSPITPVDDAFNPGKETVWAFIRRKTTNPSVAYPSTDSGDGGSSTNATAEAGVAEAVAAAFKEIGSDKAPVTSHGADTDGDGVPDGWELYTYRNPNAAPDLDENGRTNANRDFDDDDLVYAAEYAGVDACNAYKDCESIYSRHPGNRSGWWNKFLPTNPGTMKVNLNGQRVVYAGQGNDDGADTDGDGIGDGREGSAWHAVFANGGVKNAMHQRRATLGFVYGTIEDDMRTVCFRGGGMNPCTVDTDVDGIPDGWEMQHAGVPVRLPDKKVIAPRNGNVYDIELDDATFIADGVYDRAPAGTNTIVYIAGGMDATWGGDASFEDADNGLSYDSLLGTRRDVDFDHDGLQNYQEYLTQAMRHFRYDDITTPLMGRQLEEGTYDPAMRLVTLHSQSFGDKTGGTDGTGTGYPVFDSADPETFAANAAEAWNGLTFVEYATITTGVREITKVVDEATGETVTNKIYYTALKKRFIGNAELVAKHVSSGGTGVQQPWTVEGWRALGYFAPPAHDWDRAAARRDSAASAVPQKLYMFPVTGHMAVYDLSSPGWSVAGYATTDPRIADTDDDGMDDYYEMFHGLNPLLGTTPANAGVTAWISYKRGDVISAQYAMAASTPFDTAVMYFNAWYNEWVYPTFNGLLARMGMAPEDAVGAPIQAPQAYDPVLYPWGMGTPLVDADGDGIRNDEERIAANVADPVARHTDPTPLWFTERTTPASYVAQYYVMSPALKRAMGGYWLASAGVNVEPSVLTNVKTDTIRIMYGDPDYVYGFEENEGYDTDGDVTPDTFEVVTMTRPSSDPLRFDDPSRRQALYLPGEESYAMSRDLQERPFEAMDFLKQFTVECWVLPERSGAAQTVVDRCVAYEGDAIGTDKVAIRSNFRIGIDAQDHAYGMFDNNDSIESGLDAPRSCQFVDGGLIKIGEWTHIALTYDGSRLAIYVNGVEMSSATTTLVPANGIVMLSQDVSSTNGFQNVGYASAPSTLIVGARPKKENVYALYPYYIDAQGMHMESFDNLQEYFKGYVDELRVWDGARTAEQIAANFRRSIGYDEAKANRDEVFESWYLNGGTRNNNDGRPNLPAELALNFDFSSIAGAAEPGDVAKTPAGFVDNVVVAALSDYASNPDIDATGLYDNIGELKGDATIDDYMLVGWWNDSLVHSKVYDDYHVVPWIKDTVSHLPRLDGGSPDSFVYGDFFGAQYTPVAAFELDKFTFPNTAVPYSSVLYGRDNYYRIAYSLRLYDERGQAYRSNFAKCRFQARNTFSASADLVPLGGAYAKTCPAMWDGSPADPWEQTGDDTNGDGLPDWWEEYARHNYSPNVEPGAPVLWSTTVTRYFGGYGVEMPAGKAYVIDLYRGMQPDGTIDPAYAVSADDDGDGLPDWWQRLYGVAGLDPDEDPDNDGLSIYQEWLVSWGEEYGLGLSNGYPLLDPMRARTASGQKETDYFLRAVVDPYEGYYLGEIVADFDMMEDLVENDLGTDNTLFDAWSDYDEDGWTAWAELRYSTFKASQASRFLSHYAGDDEVADSPVPVVRATLRYNGVPPASASNRTVYVQAYAGNNMLKSPSATYVARPGTSETRQFYLGMPEDRVVHGTLAPGFVQSIEGAVRLQYAFVQSADSYSWRVAGEEMTHTGSYADLRAAIIQHGADLEVAALAYDWNDVNGGFTATDGTRDALTVGVDDATQRGYLLLDLERVGEIDFMTGDFTFDLSRIAGHTFTDSAIAADNCFFRIVYSVKLPTLQTGSLSLSLAKPDSGALTEGTAAFTAFIDFDGDGAYTPDTDPFGFVKDVEVGWDRVPEIVIEMTDDSAAAGKRIAYPEDAGIVRIIRTAINGEETIDGEDVKRRIVYSRDTSTTDRTDINEADLVTGGKFGLDWTNLRSDVEAMAGISIRNVSSVTYTVAKGGGSVLNIDPTNVLETFTVNFPAEQVKPSAVSPSEYSGPIVETQRPTFKWMGAADNTAFVLQILDAATNAVYTSDMQVLPARDSSGAYAWKAPVYIGTNVCGEAWSLDNGSNYLWRVAMFSQKFSNTNLEAAAWSDFAAFDTALAPVGARSTLYGAADVTVRYFGPATNELKDVVVQLYSTADFTGAPAAQSRLFDIDGTVESLTNDAYTVRFLGLEPGDYYAVAYIDRSGDLRRQRFESWGYANQIGTGSSALYTPVALRIVAQSSVTPAVEIFVEDTDINQNDVPDCLDDEEILVFAASTVAGADSSDVDGDGLTADEETGDTYTDSSLWDTDGDGMPDGWEARFADTDPLFNDSVAMVSGDVMAYAEETWKLVTDASGAFYLLNPTNETVHVGDDLPLSRLVATYDYPVYLGIDNLVNRYGVGTNLVDDVTMFRVAKVENVTIALLHAQVYAAYGFNRLTANAAAYETGNAENTKEFTALDKYLLIRYFEALGLCTEAEVNAGKTWAQYSLKPNDPDNDRDGVPDGWELYVMFGPDGATDTLAAAPISPWNYDDARTVAPAAGSELTVLEEWDDGSPSDPYSIDTDLDGISDADAYKFHLKSDEMELADDDNDGLSNWSEYLASKLTGKEFDVTNPTTFDNRLDYFYQVTQDGVTKYIGECIDNDGLGLIADHDFMEDWWEDYYDVTSSPIFDNVPSPAAHRDANRYVYDPYADRDGDGWSNWAEARSSNWRGYFYDDLVDTWIASGEDYNLKSYPMPTIKVMPLYYGLQKPVVGHSLIVRAWKNGSQDIVTYKATGSDVGSGNQGTAGSAIIGVYDKPIVMHGHLHPGHILPDSGAKFEYRAINAEEFYHWHCTYCNRPETITRFPEYNEHVQMHGEATEGGGKGVVLDLVTSDPTTVFARTVSGPDGRTGSIVMMTNSVVVGSINFLTGEYTLDLAKVAATGCSLEGCFFRASWDYRIGREWPQAFYISMPSEGRLLEGLNTIEAFIDVDENGVYTLGEPYGFVRDVNVGWDEVPEIKIELRDEPSTAKRFTVDSHSETGKSRVRVMRTAINGVEVRQRAIYSKMLDLAGGRTFTEADFIKDSEFDFDWAKLVPDAKKLAGIAMDAIRTVDYAVYVGDDTTNAVATFTRSFDSAGIAPATSGASSNYTHVVAEAQPTLAWRASDGYTAYTLQIAKDADFEEVIYSTTNLMPAVTSEGCTYRPEIYVGDGLEDGTNYYWRVAQLNAKFTTNKWSKVATFRTAVNVDNADTGYGRLAVDVRYFGPSDAVLSNVVVGVYESADFTCAPIARKRLSGEESVSTLVNDSMKPFMEVSTNIVIDGIAPGRWYVMAFIDKNGNGKRDYWESWGYVNKIGSDEADIYTPVAFEVVSTKTATPSKILVIEDTDVNQNWTPDCLEDDELQAWVPPSDLTPGSSGADFDGDGLDDSGEDEADTDPDVWDSDGDGMPDGWEAVFAETDPIFFDADTVIDGDVMAYAEETWKLVTDADGAEYLLNPTNETVHVGDDLPLSRLVTAYDYPVYTAPTNVVHNYGVGTNLLDDATLFRVAKVEDVTAVFVHAQVYDAYGYNQLTAVPVKDAVNTKPFTALDKYLLIRYFEALGLCSEEDVNVNRRWAEFSLLPNDLDNDRDGVADGWELYVMFGTNDVTSTLADATISPFNYDDARTVAPAAGSALTVLDEYDRGHIPTDPWVVDTDRDGIPDNLAFKYHTKGSDGREDFDGDGLSNYVEYMLAEVFKVAAFDPDNAFSVNPYLSDYFFRLTDVYVGEVFTDNDQVSDQWESSYLPASGGLVSPYAYDADNDADFDGWSNYAEFRAGTDPTRIQSQETVVKADDEGKETTSTVNKAQYPVPTVELKVAYLGTQNIGGCPLVVQAWSDKTMQTIPDAVWTVGGEAGGKTGGDADSGDGQASSNVVGLAVSTYYLTESDQRTSSLNTSGHLREGSNLFVAFYDRDGDGAYTPGEPYGMVRDVDVGWSSAKASVELTDTTPVIPRYKLTEGGASSGGSGVQASGGADATDREALWEATLTDVYTVTGSVIAASEKSHVRVRVVRFAIDGLSSCLPTNYMAVVFDRVLDLTGDGRPSLTEADILSDPRNEFDIDWKANALSSSVRTLQQTYTAYSSRCAFTNMLYAVYTGDGSVVPGDYTNKAVLAKILKRKFGRIREYATPEQMPEGVLTTPAPTFRWRMVPSGSGLSTYTAFRVRIKNSAGTTVWTGPMKLLPPRDAEGYYSWTPPIRVGCVFPGTTTLFENGKQYSWEISTYNAMYNTADNTDWKSGGIFLANVPESAPDYGTAKVAVRYFGPASVLSKLAGKIIVQAFTTPDFSGDPVAAGYVTDTSEVSSTNAITNANARVIGLTQGTYYLLAFIDTQNDGVRSSIVNEAGRASRWESWGCYCVRDEKDGAIFTPKPVVVGPYVGGGDVMPIYVEDCDVDGDRLPDAWEWTENGKLTQWGVKQKIDKVLAGFAMNSALTGLQNVDDGMPAGLEVAMSSLGSPRLAALMLGADATGSDDEVLSSLDSVKKVEPVSVAITGIEIDGATGSVTIRTSTEVAPSDSPALAFFELDGAEALTLDCQVWRADSLDGEWSRFGEPAKVTIGTEASEITVDVGDGLRAAGGFFKVTLEK